VQFQHFAVVGYGFSIVVSFMAIASIRNIANLDVESKFISISPALLVFLCPAMLRSVDSAKFAKYTVAAEVLLS